MINIFGILNNISTFVHAIRHKQNLAVMKTTYHIIEKNEALVMIPRDMFTKVYKTDGIEVRLSVFTRTSLVEAKKIAKGCGMDVAVWVGTEKQNDERVYVS